MRQYHVSATSTLNTTICGRMRNAKMYIAPPFVQIERRIAATEKAEHERGAGTRRGFDGVHHVVRKQQRVANRSEPQQRERQHELHRQTDDDRARTDVASIFAR